MLYSGPVQSFISASQDTLQPTKPRCTTSITGESERSTDNGCTNSSTGNAFQDALMRGKEIHNKLSQSHGGKNYFFTECI